MRNNISVFSVAVVLVSVVGVPTLTASEEIRCTHPSHKDITQILHSRVRFIDVRSYLNGKKISHGISDKNEQEVDISKISKQGLRRRGPLSVVIASKFEKKSKWSLVTGGELLIIAFDNNQRLKRYSCEKYFTGP
jgi:hypothetical protein